jgi:putative NADH-flavin reductase
VISDEALLTKALTGCDAVVTVPISVRQLKATGLVTSLAKATAANGVKRLAFTAGEITAVHEEDETYTFRQKMLLAVATALMSVTPYSLPDMRKTTALIKQQPDWDWTIVRAPTLTETPAVGYKLCGLSDVTSKHKLSREDYAACLLNTLKEPSHQRRMLTVISADL